MSEYISFGLREDNPVEALVLVITDLLHLVYYTLEDKTPLNWEGPQLAL